jgi:hypothetical protein
MHELLLSFSREWFNIRFSLEDEKDSAIYVQPGVNAHLIVQKDIYFWVVSVTLGKIFPCSQ